MTATLFELPAIARARGGPVGFSYARPDGGSDEWYTPPHIFDALGLTFDVDVSAPRDGVPWVPARRWFSRDDDGLSQDWDGRVWMNPPYGRNIGAWLARMADHAHGIALVFARTDTDWWHEHATTADLACFIRGRLTFLRWDGQRRREGGGNSGAPSVLLAWGGDCADAVAASALGWVVRK